MGKIDIESLLWCSLLLPNCLAGTPIVLVGQVIKQVTLKFQFSDRSRDRSKLVERSQADVCCRLIVTSACLANAPVKPGDA